MFFKCLGNLIIWKVELPQGSLRKIIKKSKLKKTKILLLKKTKNHKYIVAKSYF